MIDATSFADAEAAIVAVLKAARPDLYASNKTPKPIPSEAVVVGYAGGGYREWGESAVNVGINVYASADEDEAGGCRALVKWVQNILAVASNDEIESVTVPAGGAVSVPRQTPPYQRYFVVTVRLRGQAVIEEIDAS